MRNRVNINGVQVPVRHAAFARFALGGYQYLTKKKKMAPITPPNSNPFKNKKQKVQAPNFGVQAITKAASRHRGKSTAFARKKNVKVSRKLRKKILKVLEGKTLSGSWKQVSFDTIKASSFGTNLQRVGGFGKIVNADYSDWAFDPEDFLHALSVLWKQKPDNQTTRPWNSPLNFGQTDNADPTVVFNKDAVYSGQYNLYMNGFEFTVKNSHETYKLKNNTQRTIVFKIWLLAPKTTGYKTATPSLANRNVITGSTVSATIGSIGVPEDVWEEMLYDQSTMNMNLGGATAETLYMDPTATPRFNALFKSDCTTVVLEPGQVYDYFIQGPQNKKIKFADFFASTASTGEEPSYQGIQKFMRYPMFAAYLDLVTDGDRSGHYQPTIALGGANGVSFERIMSFQLEMPEQAGMTIGLPTTTSNATGTLANNLRRSAYFHKVYTPAGPTGSLNRIDVQNPPDEMDVS